MPTEVFRVGTDAESHPKTSSGETSSSLGQKGMFNKAGDVRIT